MREALVSFSLCGYKCLSQLLQEHPPLAEHPLLIRHPGLVDLVPYHEGIVIMIL